MPQTTMKVKFDASRASKVKPGDAGGENSNANLKKNWGGKQAAKNKSNANLKKARKRLKLPAHDDVDLSDDAGCLPLQQGIPPTVKKIRLGVDFAGICRAHFALKQIRRQKLSSNFP